MMHNHAPDIFTDILCLNNKYVDFEINFYSVKFWTIINFPTSFFSF